MTAGLNGTRHDGQPAVVAVSWREERRLDRLAAAESARQDRRAELDARVAADEARDRRKRERRRSRREDRATARYRRTGRRTALAAWFREHVTSLLFVPVIAVPGLLAWTAMASYGASLYGPAGVILPAFSEGGMWVFAAATTIRRHRHPDSPVWHLRLGTAVFAAYGAALNFAHGLASGSLVTGAVMALVSVAGVVAHQLITAGPRRSRAERSAARDRKLAARRERLIRRAALRRAVAVLDADGGVRLVHEPGAVTLDRRWGRAHLEPAAPAEAGPEAALGDVLAAEAVAAYRDWKEAFQAAPVRPPAVPALAAQVIPEHRTQVTRAPAAGAVPQADSGQPAEGNSSQPGKETQVTRRPPRRKTRVTRQGVSDDDLRDELRSVLKSDPDITLAAAAKKLKRGRDRIRPLLEEVRRETGRPPQ